MATTDNPTLQSEKPEPMGLPERIYVPLSGAQLVAVSPELQNVEGAWYVVESRAPVAPQEDDAPTTLKLWICCHCGNPRLYGSGECKYCGKQLHDTGEYVRRGVAAPSPASSPVHTLLLNDGAVERNTIAAATSTPVEQERDG